jgi:hypothetical protein
VFVGVLLQMISFVGFENPMMNKRMPLERVRQEFQPVVHHEPMQRPFE